MSSPAPVVLDARSLGVIYPGPVRALEGIELQIRAGEFVSLVGPSGCGKSTLLRLAAGLARPSEGELSVQPTGVPASNSPGRLGIVFQDATLLPWRSVTDNVALPLELAGQRRSARHPLAAKLLALVGLTEFANRYPRELSGGMRMRVALARALVTNPGLMLLDEPFAALDEITRQSLGEELHRLWARDRWTAIFVTHNVAEAAFLSTRVIVMSARPGRIVADLAVPFPRPRDAGLRATAAFAEFCGQVSATLLGGARP